MHLLHSYYIYIAMEGDKLLANTLHVLDSRNWLTYGIAGEILMII